MKGNMNLPPITPVEKTRKIFHAFSSLFMLIYFIPDEVFGIRHEWFFFGPFILFVIVDLGRISQGWLFPFMREYERTQVSGFTWAGATLILAVILFPPNLVIPIYVCWALLDPLCSVLKKRSALYPILPFTIYVGLFLFLTWFPGPGHLTAFGLMGDIAAALLTATVALVLEYPNLKGFNDDFLMVFGPLVALSVFNELVILL